MVHSEVIWNDVLEVVIAEKFLKSWAIDVSFWGYLKRCSWSWNCWENFEILDDRWFILRLFETTFWKLQLLRQIWKLWGEMVHSGLLWNNVFEVGTAEKKWKQRGKMVHYDAIWRDVLEVGTADNISNNRRLIKNVLVLKCFYFSNLVCSKSGIRRTKLLPPEYHLKWPGIWRTKKKGWFHPHIF